MQDTEQIIQNFIFSDIVQKFKACSNTQTFVYLIYEEYKKFILKNVSSSYIQQQFFIKGDLQMNISKIIINLLKYFLTEINIYFYHILLGYFLIQRNIITNEQFNEQLLAQDELVLSALYVYALLIHQNIADIDSVITEMVTKYKIQLALKSSMQEYIEAVNQYQVNSQIFQSYPLFWTQYGNDQVIVKSIQTILQQKSHIVENLFWNRYVDSNILNNNSQQFDQATKGYPESQNMSEIDLDINNSEDEIQLEPQSISSSYQLAQDFINTYKGKMNIVLYTLCLSHIFSNTGNQLITMQELILLLQESNIEEIYQYIIIYELCKQYSMHDMKEMQYYIQEFETQLDYIKKLDQSTKWTEYMIIQYQGRQNNKQNLSQSICSTRHQDKLQLFINNMRLTLLQQLDIKCLTLGILQQEMKEVLLTEEGIKKQSKQFTDENFIYQQDFDAFSKKRPFLARRYIKETLFDIQNYKLKVYDEDMFMNAIQPDLYYDYAYINNIFTQLLITDYNQTSTK